MAEGVSPIVDLDGAEFKLQKGYTISKIKDESIKANPPKPNSTEPSKAMENFQNPFSDFAFDKITTPDYGNDGSLARITGIPANKPDYISDHHVIGLMRCIDYMLSKGYSGTITGTYDTPNAK